MLVLGVAELSTVIIAAEQEGPPQWYQEGPQDEKDLHQGGTTVAGLEAQGRL